MGQARLEQRFAPWLAGATVLVYTYARFDTAELLAVLERTGVTTFCAPPTVWRMLVQTDQTAAGALPAGGAVGRRATQPEVIEQVRSLGMTIRDGYGQTETTAQVGNPPGAEVRAGSMGRPLPGYRVVLVAPGQAHSPSSSRCSPVAGSTSTTR